MNLRYSLIYKVGTGVWYRRHPIPQAVNGLALSCMWGGRFIPRPHKFFGHTRSERLFFLGSLPFSHQRPFFIKIKVYFIFARMLVVRHSSCTAGQEDAHRHQEITSMPYSTKSGSVVTTGM